MNEDPFSDDTLLTDEDHALLRRVDEELDRGLALHQWWEQEGESDPDIERFRLTEEFRGGGAWGFRASGARFGHRPVIGSVQRIPFTRTKALPGREGQAAHWTCGQVRQFALEYFMRVTSYARAQVYPELGHPPLPPYLEPFSWYPPTGVERAGAGFAQRYCKHRDGRFGKCPEAQCRAIVDLRSIGETYEWVLVEAAFFESSLTLSFLGPGAPRLVVPLKQRALIALCPDLITDREHASGACRGSYGPGFVLIQAQDPHMDSIRPAFEKLWFEVSDKGEVEVRVIFVCQEPAPTLGFTHEPMDWWRELAELMTSRFAGAGRDRGPARGADSRAWSATRAMSGRASGEDFVRKFLFERCVAQQRLVLGTAQTWNQIPNWLDPGAIPQWVRTGVVTEEVS